MNSPSYVLRVSVKVLGKKPVNGLETKQTISVGQVTVTVKQRERFLILLARDFASEAEAEAFLPRMKNGLWNVAIEHNVAFVPFFERRTITRPADPLKAARNLAKSFGQPLAEPIEPVHGLTEEEGYTIFRSGENIRYLAMGEASAYVSTSWHAFGRTLTEGIEKSSRAAEMLDDKLATAIDLYLASFYERSIRARFLTLIICLELLAPVTDRHRAAVKALSDFKRQLEVELAEAAEAEDRDALRTLLREIDFKKETSKRRRVRSLILSEAPLPKDERVSLAKKIADAYDLRSDVVHSGAVNSNALSEADETALRAVKLLLSVRLGLATQPPDELVVQ
jgi:hypothetical protein